MMRQNKNLMDINIDALYNILKQNQGDVNNAMGSKKKTVVVTSDPLALIAEKTNVSRSKEKVVVSSDSEGSEADDFSELKKTTALLAKAFNQRKFYSNPTNNNLRTSSTSQSAKQKQEFVKSDDKQGVKKADEKKRDMSKVKCYNGKKEGHFAKDCKKVKEINANMVFMAQIEKVLSDSEASSSSADEKISEWREQFMNYLEEQTDGEVMINSIQNGDQPLPVIAQVSLVGNIDRLARSLLIQGLPNDIYSIIDSNEATKDLWDALERQMCGSEYGEQDRKAAILYEYETSKATEGEQLLDTYLRYLQKQYGTLMRQTKNLMDINIDALYNIIKQNQGDVNDALGYKKKSIVITSDPLALVAEKMEVSKRKEKVVVSSDSKGSGANDFSELKKITSSNKKQEFVKSDDKKVKKKNDEKKRDMSKVKCYNCKKEGHFAKDCKKAKIKDYNYYKTKMLLAKKDSDE
nr:hypothetical protein [Tanacetum cinerariifolium]